MRYFRGSDQRSHHSTTVAMVVCVQVGSLHMPSYSNEPSDTASHMDTVALHVIIMIFIGIATVSKESLL